MACFNLCLNHHVFFIFLEMVTHKRTILHLDLCKKADMSQLCYYYMLSSTLSLMYSFKLGQREPMGHCFKQVVGNDLKKP